MRSFLNFDSHDSLHGLIMALYRQFYLSFTRFSCAQTALFHTMTRKVACLLDVVNLSFGLLADQMISLYGQKFYNFLSFGFF